MIPTFAQLAVNAGAFSMTLGTLTVLILAALLAGVLAALVVSPEAREFVLRLLELILRKDPGGDPGGGYQRPPAP